MSKWANFAEELARYEQALLVFMLWKMGEV